MAKEENPLTSMLASLGENAKKVIPALQEEIREEAKAVYDSMKAHTPVGDGAGGVHLRDTLEMTEARSPRKWGYKIDYVGYRTEADGSQTPYSVIARSLNKGREGRYAPTHHIDDAVRLLKGMDKRLAKKAEEVLSEGIED